MLENIVNNYCPGDWRSKDFGALKLCDVQSDSSQYFVLQSLLSSSFNLGVERIVKVESSYLYGQFLLKKEEYETRGYCSTKELYHDTAAHKIDSILNDNLDWRLAHRVKYGQGVSFSPSPAYANRESSRNNGTDRAMIVADVLVQKQQTVSVSLNLPSNDCDTTVGNCGQVYVKYYDDEFYPKFIIYYKSKPVIYRYRRRF